MKKLILRLVFALLLAAGMNEHVRAQLSYDTTRTMDRKNVVRYNVTPSLIAGVETFTVGYERRIKPHQTVSINIGSLKFRKFVNLGLDQYDINTNRNSGGYTIAIDFRQYFKKRNRGFAPDGLYWAPFLTLYNYKHEIGLSYQDISGLTTTEAGLKAELGMYHVGVELGYQFVIAKRVTVDLIFIGPSWGKYRGDFEINGGLSVDQENEVLKEFYDIIVGRLPGLGILLEDRKLTKGGHFSSNTLGMRYVMQIGILF